MIAPGQQIATLPDRSYTRGDYTIDTNPARLDVDAIHAYLVDAYWSVGRTRPIVEESLRHSINFGLYHGQSQVGLARVISDCAIFAYLCDVYILEEHRGYGLGKWLIDTVLHDPAFATVRRWMLATNDAHGLYTQFGFTPLARPHIMMELLPKR
jgi:GNAT superfamily N-acetyltransferase